MYYNVEVACWFPYCMSNFYMSRWLRASNFALLQRSSFTVSRVPVEAGTIGRSALFHSSAMRGYDDIPFQRPGPPPLPKEDQREFEELVRQKEGVSLWKTASDHRPSRLYFTRRRRKCRQSTP